MDLGLGCLSNYHAHWVYCTLKPLCNNINNTNNKKINNLNIATLNIHSLNKKSLCIFDLVSANDLDLFLLTETWHESASSPSLLASIPQGFSFVEQARPPLHPLSSLHSSYGGICLLFKSSYSVSLNSSIKFSSFECLFTSIDRKSVV